MSRFPQEIAAQLLRRSFEELSELERGVVRHFADRRHVSHNVNRAFREQLSQGQRLADRMTAFGGSWTFIGLALALLAIWLILNSIVLKRVGRPFDPFPFILLNLVLSCVAALMALPEKLDTLREQQWSELIELQRRQLALHEGIVAARDRAGGSREDA